jgi:hypothetical protein
MSPPIQEIVGDLHLRMNRGVCTLILNGKYVYYQNLITLFQSPEILQCHLAEIRSKQIANLNYGVPRA